MTPEVEKLVQAHVQRIAERGAKAPWATTSTDIRSSPMPSRRTTGRGSRRPLGPVGLARRLVTAALLILIVALGLVAGQSILATNGLTSAPLPLGSGTATITWNRDSVTSQKFTGHARSLSLSGVETLTSGRFDVRGSIDGTPFSITLVGHLDVSSLTLVLTATGTYGSTPVHATLTLYKSARDYVHLTGTIGDLKLAATGRAPIETQLTGSETVSFTLST